MNTSIFLMRHGQSLKNTLNAYSTFSGKEPLTRFEKQQSERLADSVLEYYNSRKLEKLSLYVANDKRQYSQRHLYQKNFK